MSWNFAICQSLACNITLRSLPSSVLILLLFLRKKLATFSESVLIFGKTFSNSFFLGLILSSLFYPKSNPSNWILCYYILPGS